MNNHICDKSEIKWKSKPECESDLIIWRGKCGICKREVYETYSQNDELYDANTDEEI